MLIINKKKIKIIVLGVIIALFVFTFQIAQNKENNEIKNLNEIVDNSIATTATPVSGKTVVLDAGHGVPDEGAESSSRHNRSRNKLKNNIKSTKLTRAKWMQRNINTL